MTLTISHDEAAVAARQILGCYPDIPASDPKRFVAGLVGLLSTYPRPVIVRAVDPRIGIAVHIEFLNLARIKKLLDEWRDEHFQDLHRREIAARKPLPEPIQNPEVRERIQVGLRQLSAALRAGMVQ